MAFHYIPWRSSDSTQETKAALFGMEESQPWTPKVSTNSKTDSLNVETYFFSSIRKISLLSSSSSRWFLGSLALIRVIGSLGLHLRCITPT